MDSYPYEHSTELDPSLYEKLDCLTTLPIRIHKHKELADESSRKWAKDWDDSVGKTSYSQNLGRSPIGNLSTLAFPECIPNRLTVMTNHADWMCTADDAYESASTHQKSIMGTMTGIFSFVDSDKYPMEDNPKHLQMLARLVMEVQKLDAPARQAWEAIYNDISNNIETIGAMTTDYTTLDAYIPLRFIHSVVILARNLIAASNGIQVSDEEAASIDHIVKPLLVSTMLTNDYHSYQKEKTQGQNLGVHIINAVPVLMAEYSISEDDGLALLREKIVQYEDEHKREFEREKQDNTLTENKIQYITLIRLFAAGSSVWHAATVRYGTDNTLQHINNITSPLKGPEPGLAVSKKDSPEDAKKLCNDSQAHDIKRVKPESTLVSMPYNYIASLPSKKKREVFIQALQAWLEVSAADLQRITSIVSKLHNITLMVDDIEDKSPMRRAKPSTHVIFGECQTFNSANYIFINVLAEARKLSNPECLAILIDETENLCLGQGLDLNWRHSKRCPTIDEYIMMVDAKTGSLLNLAVRLMRAQSSTKQDTSAIESFAILFGRYFQIRDDLKNLESDQYTAQKGFCEDLDESKFSFPLIHSLGSSTSGKPGDWDANANTILGILHNPPAGGLTIELKQYVLNHLKNNTKSLEYTASILDGMMSQMLSLIEKVERETGVENPLLRMILKGLSATG